MTDLGRGSILHVVLGSVPALLIGVTLQACAGPPPRDLESLVVAGDTYVDPSTDAPFSGRVVRYFDEDGSRVQLTGTLQEGIWHGELTVYHRNGRTRYAGSFEHGERCGAWTENADSLPASDAYSELVREVESMGVYPPCVERR